MAHKIASMVFKSLNSDPSTADPASGQRSRSHPEGGGNFGASSRRLFNGFRLRTILIVPFVVPIFVSTALVGWFSFRNGQQAVNDLADQLQFEVSNRIEQHLSSYLAIPNQINHINRDAINLGLLNPNDFQQTGKYFWRQMRVFPVSYISFCNPQGEFIGVERQEGGKELTVNEITRAQGIRRVREYATNSQGDRTNLLETRDWNPLPEPWYADTVRAKKPIWSPIYQWEDKPAIMSVSANYPLYNNRQQLIGVLSIDHVLSQINQYLRQINLSPTGKTFIIERDGFLVASSTEAPSYEIKEKKPRRLKAAEVSDRTIQTTAQMMEQQLGNLHQLEGHRQLILNFNNQRQFVQISPWRDALGLNWLIVTVVPESDFMTQINANTRTTLWLCLGTLTLATAVGVLTARWISRLIHKLNRASRQIAQGNLDQHVDIQGIQELHTLANSFNSMTDQLKGFFAALKTQNHHLEQTQAALQKTEARNRALLNAIPDLMLEVSADGVYLDCIEVKTGKWIVTNPQERLGRRVEDILPPAIAQQYMQAIQQVLQTGEPQTLEYEIELDGELNIFEARAVAYSESSAFFIVRNVTDRKNAEVALRQSESTNRALIAAIPDLLMRVTGDGVYLNIAGRDRFNVQNNSQLLVGRTVYDSLPPDKAELRMNYIRRTLETGQMQLYEQQFVVDEAVQYEEVRIVVSGENEVLVMVRDITDRKRAEEALRIAEQNYRSIYENALEGIFQSTPEGRYLSINPAMSRMNGYACPEEMLQDVTEIGNQLYVDPQQREEFKHLMETQGEVKEFEYQVYRRDGSIMWVEENTRAVRTIDGQVSYYEGIVQDITERKQAEEALRIAEETYRSIFENALDGIFQSTPDGRYLRVNPAMARMCGYDSPEELMQAVSDIRAQIYVNPGDREVFRRLIEHQGIVTGLEYQIYRKDGTIIWISESTCAVQDAKGELLYYAGIIQDVTDRRRREEELRRQLEELRIEIDQKKRELEVAMITESGYFQELQQEVSKINLDEFWS